MIKNVFEQRGEMFKNIVVPFTDGKRAYNVVANLEKTYKSEGEELIRLMRSRSCWLILMMLERAFA